jgi:hypothetical protein
MCSRVALRYLADIADATLPKTCVTRGQRVWSEFFCAVPFDDHRARIHSPPVAWGAILLGLKLSANFQAAITTAVALQRWYVAVTASHLQIINPVDPQMTRFEYKSQMPSITPLSPTKSYTSHGKQCRCGSACQPAAAGLCRDSEWAAAPTARHTAIQMHRSMDCAHVEDTADPRHTCMQIHGTYVHWGRKDGSNTHSWNTCLKSLHMHWIQTASCSSA